MIERSIWPRSASAARFDFAKLENLNGHYIRQPTTALVAVQAC